MKTLPIAIVSLAVWISQPAAAATLMLDFGPTTATAPYLTLSPAHDAGLVAGGETAWNGIVSSAQATSLNWSDGTVASGVSLTMGQGLKSSSTITYTNSPSFTGSLAGTGGAVANQEKLTTNKGSSIYGPASGSTSVALDALFSSVSDTAIGFRIDGLTSGDYLVYVMARNGNSNAPSGNGTNIYASAGASSMAFDFSTLTAAAQSNPGYASATYVDEYGSFIEGENFVVIPLSVGNDQSLFLSVEGQGSGTAGRGFINSIQIVQVPEPSAALLGAVGLLGLLRRSRG